MGGGAAKGGTNQAEKNIQTNTSALTGLATQQQGQSTQLYNSAFPGFQSAEGFYNALSSGDPTAIARAISPATQQISQATTGAKQNIMANDPSGGEKNLALEQANLNQGAQVGSTASQGYLNSFNALAKLAGQGIGESGSAASRAFGGLDSANQGNLTTANLGIQQKGATLGAVGGLLGSGLSGAASGGSKGGGSESVGGGKGGGGGAGIGQLLSAQSGGATAGLSTELPDLSALMVA